MDAGSEDPDEQCRQLLRSLKGTAEGLLASHTANVWSVYGGLSRLHSAVLKILQHGLQVFNSQGEPDCWSFVEALQWLQPSLATSPPFHPSLPSPSSSPGNEARHTRYVDWLYRSLESHTLSAKLSWLVSDTPHLEASYAPHAFLRRQQYSEAALICLRAIEQGQPSLLTDLDPRLYLSQWTSKHFVRSHRRCSSFPDNLRPSCAASRPSRKSRRSTALLRPQLSCPAPLASPRLLDRQWHSEPSLAVVPAEGRARPRGRSATTTETKRRKPTNFQSLLSVNYADLQKTSRENVLKTQEKPDIVIQINRDSIELASEASEDICTNVSEVQSKDMNEQRNSSLTVAVLAEPVIECSSSDSKPIEIIAKRPTNLSLSMTTSTDIAKVKSLAQVRRASDTIIHTKEPEIDIQRQLQSSNPQDIQFPFKPAYSSSPKASHSPHKPAARGHRKNPSDPSFVPTVAYEHTPPRGAPSYTPSSSLSLSPPLPPLASYCSLPHSRRTSEASSFLASSGRFSDPAEELGRENAHFSVSEAMIAAIERAKCERVERGRTTQRGAASVADDTLNSEEEDDEEIARLKERIRVRRREKEQREKRQLARSRRALRVRRPQQPQTLLSDGRTDTGTPNTTTATDQSDVTPPSSPSPSSSEAGEGSRDLLVESDRPGAPGDNLARLRDSGLSMSLASLYSESELAARQPARLEDSLGAMAGGPTVGPPGPHWSRTAEGVAWGLLRQFSGKALPRDSELQWLVSEQDAPQQLLPLPSSWPVSPDEAEDEDMTRATQLRGTLQWAPPRPQIIFTPHPAPNRRVLLARQGYLCAGCGMRVEPQYASKFRYCEYLGRYFCTACHRNQVAVIPGKVLAKWDFNRCPVSGFSYRLLEQMQADALFRVEDLNPSLFRKSRQLAKCKLARMQVSQLRDFVINCRFATELHEMYQREPPHLTSDPELYSLKDLLDVKSGELISRLQELLNASKTHVNSCDLCVARGFVCELCHSREVIFPWDVSRVVRCRHCGCCLHLSCWKGSHTPATSPSLASPEDCPRCLRIRARHNQRACEA